MLEGITIGGKSMRAHFEVINHKEAIDYVEAVIAGDEVFSERLIKAIHQLMLKNIDSPNTGVYRHENVLIADAEHRPPDFLHVPEQMADLVRAYHDFAGHPIERAARLLMNFDLMKAGFLPVIFQAADRLAYYETLDKAHIQHDYQDFIQLSIAGEIKAFDTVLSLLRSA